MLNVMAATRKKIVADLALPQSDHNDNLNIWLSLALKQGWVLSSIALFQTAGSSLAIASGLNCWQGILAEVCDPTPWVGNTY